MHIIMSRAIGISELAFGISTCAIVHLLGLWNHSSNALLFQARNVSTGELAAIKVIKLEPGESALLHTQCCLTTGT